MTVLQVEIANRALGKLGVARMIDFNDDTKQARAVKNTYLLTKQQELRKYNWNFAMVRDELASLVAPPEWGFDFQYELPADCLRPVQINDFHVVSNLYSYVNRDMSPYTIEGRRILTNFAAPLRVRYVKDAEATDPLFVDVLACRLAYELANELTSDLNIKQLMMNEYQLAIRDAMRCNGIERPQSVLMDDSWVMSRLLGGGNG